MTSGSVRQFLAATSAALTIMSCGCWTGWPSPSIPNLYNGNAAIVMDHEEVSWMIAMMDIGKLVTPLPTGYLMDRFGRKKILISGGLVFLLSWALTAVAYNAWFLYMSRFLAGLANGISLTAITIYLGEIASISIRGAVSTILNLFMWIGILFELLVGPFVSFKVLVFLSAIPPVLFLLSFPFTPESPYFLCMQGRNKEALEALTWFRGSPENTSENDLTVVKEKVDNDRKNKRRFWDLVSESENRRAFFIIMFLTVFQKFMGSFSIVSYSSTTLPLTQGVFGPSEAMVIYAGVNVFSNVLLASLVDLWGRRPLLLFSAAGTALLRGFSALYYYFDRETSVDMNSLIWVPYVCVILSGFTQPGIGSIPFTLQGELLPTFVKSHASAICSVAAGISAFLVDKLYVTVEDSLGVYVDYLFFFLSGILCFIFIFVFVFETKGKSFTEIQSILRKTLNKA